MSDNVFLVVLAVVTLQTGAGANRNTTGSSIGVGLTISSLITSEPPRQLELSWWGADELPGDRIALYDSDPSSGPRAPVAARAVTTSQGYFRTNIQAPRTAYAELGYRQQCLGYWAAYVRNGSVLASKCLQTNPTWMWENRDRLKSLKLRHMFLPGTHDSAAYKIYNGEDRDTFVTKYSVTQEEDVLSQLIYGVRYLDLRVGYYKKNPEVWWANHGVVRIHPLRDIFEQIKIFMRNTNEIVIIDIQEFSTGFGSDLEVHLKLVQFLVRELSSYMAMPTLSWDARLIDIWNSGQRLIVTYDNSEVVTHSTLLWQSVEHRWGNVQSLERLHEFLEETLNSPSGYRSRPWAAMAELTPNTWSLLTNTLRSLRSMADLVNRNVTEWFRGPWGAKANVVAVDFFRGTQIVEEAIKWNLWRGSRDSQGS